MVDLSVAIAWIAISAASVKGLSALARAAATSDPDVELGSNAGDGVLPHERPYPIDARFHPSRARP